MTLTCSCGDRTSWHDDEGCHKCECRLTKKDACRAGRIALAERRESAPIKRAYKRNPDWGTMDIINFKHMWREGKSFREMMRVLGRNKNALNDMAYRLKLPRRMPRKWNPAAEKIVFERTDNMIAMLALQFGRTESAVAERVRMALYSRSRRKKRKEFSSKVSAA